MVETLVPIAICVVLPVLVVWLVTRVNINRDNANKAIVLAALEKNPDFDVEQFLEKLKPQGKSIKEKLLGRLVWSVTCLLSGAAIIAACYICDELDGIFIGGIALAVGIAFLVNFFLGRKMLAKEIQKQEESSIQ